MGFGENKWKNTSFYILSIYLLYSVVHAPWQIVCRGNTADRAFWEKAVNGHMLKIIQSNNSKFLAIWVFCQN